MQIHRLTPSVMPAHAGIHAFYEQKHSHGWPALATTVARCCRWVNIKGDWYYTNRR
jgi:hypothetical protein